MHAQSQIRTDVVALYEPKNNDDLGLLCCVKAIGNGHLASKSFTEAFIGNNLQGQSEIDPNGFDAAPLSDSPASLAQQTQEHCASGCTPGCCGVQHLDYILDTHPEIAFI